MLHLHNSSSNQSLPQFAEKLFSSTSHEWITTAFGEKGYKGTFQALSFYKLLMKNGIGFSLKEGICTFHMESIDIPAAFMQATHLWGEITASLKEDPFPLKIEKQISEGNTTKILFSTYDGYEIESVVIPMKKKNTICISSQVGCRMGCQFCETGRIGLLRNLSIAEIVAQVYIVQHILKMPIKNIVFMGMGEPFDNYDAVIQASKVFMDMNGFAFGRKNITISTSGRVREIQLFTEEALQNPMPNLAISLNSGEDHIRTKLMPYNRKYPLKTILNSITDYIEKTKREVLCAYVLLENINDQIEDADTVAAFLQPIQDHIRLNVIPYNPQSSDLFQPPSDSVIEAFMNRIRSHGIRALLRTTKGRSIMAGCGQLGNIALRQSFSQNK